MQLKHFLSPFLVTVFAFAGLFAAQTAKAELAAGEIKLVSSTRVGGTDYQHVYRLSATNPGANVVAVSATVVSSSPNTIIVDSSLSFPDLTTDSTASSFDTFEFRQNSSFPFDPAVLSFTFSYDDEPPAIDKDADGYSTAEGDCDDDNPAVNPGALEIPGNAVDENCDGFVDPGTDPVDIDKDGFTKAQGDCDDNNPAINPDALEIPGNEVDENCDGFVDPGDPGGDLDNDGFTSVQGDCNDNDPDINPDALEIPGNDVDENCDGFVDPGTDPDTDMDGYTPEEGDCDDNDPLINPGAESVPNNGVDENCDGEDPVVAPDFSVRITSPTSLSTVGVSPVPVAGTVDDLDVVLTVNGAAVTPDNSGNFAVEVTLQEGHNTIVARAVKGAQDVTDSISVSLDLTPPIVTIESHTEGQAVYTPAITVSGLINDIVRGTIEEEQAAVTVNGETATISNRSYAAMDVPLVEGENTIKVEGVDQVGNIGTTQIVVDYVIPEGRRIELVGGQDQSAKINAQLASPLAVKVIDDALEPVAKASVVFRVTQGSGAVGAGTSDVGRAVVVETDTEGMAETDFLLGSRVGVANQKVRAKVVGYDDEVVFNSSATGNIGNKISINSGNNQRGSVGQLLPEAFVVAVTDDGANVVKGARVLFNAAKGDGRLSGVGSTEFGTSFEAITDSDGRATAEYKLGFLSGVDAQRVTATLLDAPKDAEGITQLVVAGFTATGFVPAAPGLTSISGVILDNQDSPIPGVTVRIDGSERQAVADAQGQFKIEQAPVGPVHLIADGSTASVEGEFPALTYNIVTVAGVDNPLAAPIFMVKLDTDGGVLAGTEDVVLELVAYPGFKLEIAKDSVTFPNGARSGLISVTPVNADKVPMAPPNGMQPQFIVTIQPTGTRFDPPATLTLPNFDGHVAGSQVEMYSFDHDLEEFVAIGLGTVSEDATLVTSNPGVGVVKAGWHCGSQPAGQGCTHDCPVCQDCDGACNCVPADNDPRLKDCQFCDNGSLTDVSGSSDPGGAASLTFPNPYPAATAAMLGTNWGVTPLYFPVFENGAYCNGTSWALRVTKADAKITQSNRLLPGVVEVTNALIAAESDCAVLTTMATSLDSVARQGAHSGYFVLEAVVAHENVHADNYKADIAKAYTSYRATVEALAIPLKDASAEGTAKSKIRALAAFTAADAKFRQDWDDTTDDEVNHVGIQQYIDAELGVVTPFITAIGARKVTLMCPP